MIGLLVTSNWKSKISDSILIILDRSRKIVYYKLIKITIDAFDLAKIILDVIVRNYRLPVSISSYRGLVFIPKF